MEAVRKKIIEKKYWMWWNQSINQSRNF